MAFMHTIHRFAALAALGIALLAGCGGGGGTSALPPAGGGMTVTPSPAPSVTPSLWTTAFFATPAPFVAQTPDPSYAISVGATTRSYRLHIPPGYNGATAVPLVVLMHGGGTQPVASTLSYQMDPVADASGFIVAYPLGTPGSQGDYTWDAYGCCGAAQLAGVDDVGFIRTLVASLRSAYRIDPKRVYATGMSNGGFMAQRLACDASDLFAAVAAVSSALDTTACAPSQPVGVMMFNGTADQNVVYDGGYGTNQPYPRDDNPVSFAVATWTHLDACGATPYVATSTPGDIVVDTYAPCASGRQYVLYTLIGAGHEWPGSDQPGDTGDPPIEEISASSLIWTFFAAQARP